MLGDREPNERQTLPGQGVATAGPDRAGQGRGRGGRTIAAGSAEDRPVDPEPASALANPRRARAAPCRPRRPSSSAPGVPSGAGRHRGRHLRSTAGLIACEPRGGCLDAADLRADCRGVTPATEPVFGHGYDSRLRHIWTLPRYSSMPAGPPGDDGTLFRPAWPPGGRRARVSVQFGAAQDDVFPGCAAIASLVAAGTSRPAGVFVKAASMRARLAARP